MSFAPTDLAETDRPSSRIPSRQAMSRWELLKQLEKGAIGRRASDGTTIVRRGERAGCVLFGPYWHFSSGHYRIDFRCAARHPRLTAQPVLGVEVLVLGRFQLAARDFTIAELAAGTTSVVFEIPPELSVDAGNESRFEFRFFHLGNADLTIEVIELTRLSDPAPEQAREWRLLGRLHKSWIGRRHADGQVSVLRRERAGCVLYGGWPYLRLGRGDYRLTVRCSSASPELRTQPVLGLEIRGQSRWRNRRLWQRLLRTPPPTGVRLAQREFASAEMHAGEVTVDFTVPDDIALESGGDAPIDVRLHHFGKAALTIESVDLRRLAPSESLLPSRPHSGAQSQLSRRKKLVLIGNCQCRALAQAFNHSDSLSKSYEAKYHFVPTPPNLQEFAIRDLESCDVLLLQDVHLWDGSPLRGHQRPGADVLRFPFLRFASLWPFDGWNGPTDRDARDRESPNMTFAFFDGLLARLRNEIPDKEARFAAYRSLAVPGVINYRRLHDLETRRLLAMDQKYGLTIGAFILENFRKRQVFHTTVRPNWQGFNLLTQYILKSLGIRSSERLGPRADIAMRDPQVPVHPKVARDLGVRWANERTRYVYQGRQITWEAYIRSYIEHYG